jgi:hypothetical protein
VSKARRDVPPLDQCTEMHGNATQRSEGATKGATGSGERIKTDLSDDLRAIVNAWPNLSDPIKAGILAMVRAANSTGG